MKLTLCPLLILLLVQWKIAVVVLGAPKVPCLYIFGDSIVDNGNNLYRQTTAKVNYLPYGIDFPRGPTGRFTNGRNIADFLAEMLGFEEYIPPFVNATNEDLVRGVNYASGGCGILNQTGRHLGDVISFNEQLSNHATVISRVGELLGSKTQAKQHLNRCIYSIVLGSNDYLSTYLAELHSGNSSTLRPQEYATLLIKEYSNQLQRLYDLGGRKVAVFQIGQLGCVPGQVAAYGASNGSLCVEMSNEAVHIFNEKLNLLIDDLNNEFSDAQFLFLNSTAISYGNITNLSDPCCNLSNGYCLPEATICGNRDEYQFWDNVHPTEATYSIYAQMAYTVMAPLYTTDTEYLINTGFIRNKILNVYKV